MTYPLPHPPPPRPHPYWLFHERTCVCGGPLAEYIVASQNKLIGLGSFTMSYYYICIYICLNLIKHFCINHKIFTKMWGPPGYTPPPALPGILKWLTKITIIIDINQEPYGRAKLDVGPSAGGKGLGGRWNVVALPIPLPPPTTTDHLNTGPLPTTRLPPTTLHPTTDYHPPTTAHHPPSTAHHSPPTTRPHFFFFLI